LASESDHHYMQRALVLAAQAAALGEVPVGAVLVVGDEIVAESWNQSIHACDATAHAEIMVLRQAGARTGNYRLPGSTLYVTIEPCTMCVGALIHARVDKVIFGAPEPRAGALVSQLQLMNQTHWNHRLQFEGGVEADRAGELMQAFFKMRRENIRALRKSAKPSQ
jgi:tRNA(adenine34) deaminase